MDLLLEDIGKLPFFVEAISQAKEVVKFFKQHDFTLKLFKSLSKLTLLLPGETRFATNFIMLERILSCKGAIEELISRQDFKEWLPKQSYKEAGDRIVSTIKKEEWWEKIEVLVDLSAPVVNVLRFSDGDIPSAGKIYLEMFNMGQKLEHIIMQDSTKRVIKKDEAEEVRETFLKKYASVFPCFKCGIYVHASLLHLCMASCWGSYCLTLFCGCLFADPEDVS